MRAVKGKGMNHKEHPGQVQITFSYSRHVGPTFIHGGLTLQFDSLRPYSFVSRAQWPSTDNYETSVREAIEHVLRERQGHLDSTSVVLVRIEWDDVNSCPLGFERAAVAATRAAFEV
jgi:hypothetical protein